MKWMPLGLSSSPRRRVWGYHSARKNEQGWAECALYKQGKKARVDEYKTKAVKGPPRIRRASRQGRMDGGKW